MEFPAEAGPPEEIECRLVILHLGRGDQNRQDDARLPTINDVVIVVTQMRASVAWSERRRIGIGRTDPVIGDAAVMPACPCPIRSPHLPDPVVPVGGTFGQISTRLLRQRDGHMRQSTRSPARVIAVSFALAAFLEELSEVRLDGKPWVQRVDRRIGVDVGRVDRQFFPTHQSGRDALVNHRLEEPSEDGYAVALPDPRQAGMIGKHLAQVVPEIPPQTQPVGHDPHQLPLRAQSFEEEDQLELEEDHRVDGGAADPGIPVSNQITHKAKIERALQQAVEVTLRNEILKRDTDRFVKIAGFRWSKHDRLRVGDRKHHAGSLSIDSSARSSLFQQAGGLKKHPTRSLSRVWLR